MHHSWLRRLIASKLPRGLQVAEYGIKAELFGDSLSFFSRSPQRSFVSAEHKRRSKDDEEDEDGPIRISLTPSKKKQLPKDKPMSVDRPFIVDYSGIYEKIRREGKKPNDSEVFLRIQNAQEYSDKKRFAQIRQESPHVIRDEPEHEIHTQSQPQPETDKEPPSKVPTEHTAQTEESPQSTDSESNDAIKDKKVGVWGALKSIFK